MMIQLTAFVRAVIEQIILGAEEAVHDF